ncbi:MAG: cation transporter [Myxococcales bacterium]|nr:cation transporter [Myxococcales bacterium]
MSGHHDHHEHDHCGGHDHGPTHEHEYGHSHAHDAPDSRLRLALVFTAAFMVVEVVVGFWTGSLALVADAGHMATDAASLGIALYAAIASRRTADDRRTYGYGRARVLAAFTNGISLLAVALWIVLEAIHRLADPVPILPIPMLIVAGAGLLVNLGVYAILSGGHDLNSRGAIAHVLGDLLGSVAAIVAGVIILATGWTPIDPILSVTVALLIVRTGWSLTVESAHTLLEGSPDGFDAGLVKTSLLGAVPGTLDVHHIHAWTVDEGAAFITLHVCVAETESTDLVIERVRVHLTQTFGYRHVTVQVEYGACAEPAH